MDLELIKAHREQAAEAVNFWRDAFAAEAGPERRDYAWLWLHSEQLRQRLDEMIEGRESPGKVFRGILYGCSGER